MKCCIAAAGVFSGICLPGKWICRTVSELPWGAASRVIFFFLLSLVLSACGGGGGSIERGAARRPGITPESVARVRAANPGPLATEAVRGPGCGRWPYPSYVATGSHLGGSTYERTS